MTTPDNIYRKASVLITACFVMIGLVVLIQSSSVFAASPGGTGAVITPTVTNSNTNSANNTNATTNSSGTFNEVNIPPINDTFKGKTLSQVSLQVIRLLFLLIVIAAVVVIIIAGFKMMTGGGNPDQLKKAKSTIVWALVGLVVAFMSYAIVSIIQNILQK
jgi:Type IV secretion system pilin